MRTIAVVVLLLRAVGMAFAQTPHDVAELIQRAEAGDAEAQSDAGWAYYTGTGVPQNTDEAVKWLRRSAQLGNASGQNRLGVAYQQGQGVPKDARRAVALYRQAADQGLLQAQLNLAWTYNRGLGVRRDYAEAAVWYRKAAEQGDAGAQSDLGVAYHNGEGVKKNRREAQRWFMKAGAQGYAVATHRIGRMYWDGELEDAFSGGYMRTFGIEYFRTAAAQGYALSAVTLAEIYASRTRYVSQDYVEACLWTAIAEQLERRGEWERRQPAASDAVQQKVRALRLLLGMNLTEQQLTECQPRATAWLATNLNPKKPLPFTRD
jgi:TPR repeat protein